MGEIGISRIAFLYELPLWEIRAIANGYRKRERGAWERCRWQTFMLMHNGFVNLKEAGIYDATDLITFPWEKTQDIVMTDEEVAAERQRLIELNKLNSHEDEGQRPDTLGQRDGSSQFQDM